jgi:hypothetical protein
MHCLSAQTVSREPVDWCDRQGREVSRTVPASPSMCNSGIPSLHCPFGQYHCYGPRRDNRRHESTSRTQPRGWRRAGSACPALSGDRRALRTCCACKHGLAVAYLGAVRSRGRRPAHSVEGIPGSSPHDAFPLFACASAGAGQAGAAVGREGSGNRHAGRDAFRISRARQIFSQLQSDIRGKPLGYAAPGAGRLAIPAQDGSPLLLNACGISVTGLQTLTHVGWICPNLHSGRLQGA